MTRVQILVLPFTAVAPWGSHLAPLYLNSHICKIGMMILPSRMVVVGMSSEM